MPRILALLALLSSLSYGAADVLVVCPEEYRPTLETWVQHRSAQGHSLAIVGAPDSAAALQQSVREVAEAGHLSWLVLIGDAPVAGSAADTVADAGLPTHYADASVNVRWGSDPQIASDLPYADLDGDGSPELAVGRIPVDSADELRCVVEKIIHFEQLAASAPGRREVNFVAGAGGFGPAIDGVIDASARRLITDFIPPDHQVRLIQAHGQGKESVEPGDLRSMIHRQLSTAGRAWVYMGHGHVRQLDAIATERGPKPMLAVADLAEAPLVAPSSGHPLAVLLACYTGAFDAATDCLAEEMLVQPGGPIAVLAASRVSMPYGNTVLGYELLRATFSEEPQFATLGEMYLAVQQRVLEEATEDTTRNSLDQLARGLSPPPVDLPAERREHVAMYHLLGDPLLRMPPKGRELRVADAPDDQSTR